MDQRRWWGTGSCGARDSSRRRVRRGRTGYGLFCFQPIRNTAWTPANRGADLTEKGRGEQVGRAGSREPEVQSQTEAVLATLLDSVGCGILLAGTGGDLRAVNDRLAEMLGHAPERLRELMHLDEVVASVSPQFAQSDSVAARWRQRFQNGEPAWDELEMITPERKILERYARPVLDQYKQPRGWLEIYRDISGQRQIESRLFHSERLAALGQCSQAWPMS